jgi:hypothetical protein
MTKSGKTPLAEYLKQRKSESEDANGSVNKVIEKRQREMERRLREKIVLWRSPVTTLKYFILEASTLFTLLCARYVLHLCVQCISCIISA